MSDQDTEREERPPRRSRAQSSGSSSSSTRSAKAREGSGSRSDRGSGSSAKKQGTKPRRSSAGLDARTAVRTALDELTAILLHPAESVVGVQHEDDDWVVTIEVLEDAHIPSTSDILAEYEVRIDPGGQLLGYTRVHRYVRGRAEG